MFETTIFHKKKGAYSRKYLKVACEAYGCNTAWDQRYDGWLIVEKEGRPHLCISCRSQLRNLQFESKINKTLSDIEKGYLIF